MAKTAAQAASAELFEVVARALARELPALVERSQERLGESFQRMLDEHAQRFDRAEQRVTDMERRVVKYIANLERRLFPDPEKPTHLAPVAHPFGGMCAAPAAAPSSIERPARRLSRVCE